MQDFNWTAAYNRLNTGFKPHESRPLIGITGNHRELDTFLNEAYYRTVLEAGAIPVVIPPHDDLSILPDLLDSLDGILLSGGADMNPLFMGEEPVRGLHSVNFKRDQQELVIARLAYDRQIPMLGICRGIQMMVVAKSWAAVSMVVSLPVLPTLTPSPAVPRMHLTPSPSDKRALLLPAASWLFPPLAPFFASAQRVSRCFIASAVPWHC
jgi:hypothetical protein